MPIRQRGGKADCHKQCDPHLTAGLLRNRSGVLAEPPIAQKQVGREPPPVNRPGIAGGSVS